ncbi:MAG: hypothetical protein LBD75_08385 [Candidatus Peribacteria bacterium]|nr:hypothetical protein [Candidatus Peribacteria bacterium]
MDTTGKIVIPCKYNYV